MRCLPIFFICVAAFPVLAQHNNRVARDLQFRFGNPGARSLGFGGAFLGLADDATAPVANPAGMVRTQSRSLSLEINYNRQDNEIPFAGGEVFQSDLFEFQLNLERDEAPEDIYQVPYLAVVFPVDKWRFGIFAHQQANAERSYSSDPIRVCHLGDPRHPNCSVDDGGLQYPPSQDFLNLEMQNVGASAAVGITERLSIGVSAFFSQLDYTADSIIQFPTIIDDVQIEKLVRGDDEGFGGIVGVLWQAADQISIGATYKYQPEFDYNAILRSARELPNIPPDFDVIATFNVPDSLGFGVSVTPLEFLTVNLDAVRVYYSQITDEFIDFNDLSNDNLTLEQSMPDVTEIHLGMEYILAQFAAPVSLRAGYWLDPYHALSNNVDDSQILQGDINNPFVRDIFFLDAFAEDEDHFSFGIGLTFGRNLQLDAAVDIGDTNTNATVSGIYRF
jgi:long-chain fatty acid transport protein